MSDTVSFTLALTPCGSTEQFYFSVEMARHKWDAALGSTSAGHTLLEEIRTRLCTLAEVDGPCGIAMVYGDLETEVTHVNLDSHISSLH